MCFLKFICQTDLFELNHKPLNDPIQQKEPQFLKNEIQTLLYFPQYCFIPHLTYFNKEFQIQQWIKEAFKGIERNSQQLKQLAQKLQHCDENMIKIYKKIETLPESNPIDKLQEKKTSSHIQDSQTQLPSFNVYQSQNNLTNSLFGSKSYKYKLALVDEFPSVIYRQRNIKLAIKLIFPNGQVLKNDNVINLYLSLCDSRGKWIINNRVGDPMLKGRTSTELCSGESQFNKIYPQDISRTFFEGQVNVVIYAKSLAVVYDSKQSKKKEKTFVDPEFIEPLVLQNITIRAKKRTE